MKDMLLLYQDQVVFDDVYIEVALTKPQKWGNSVIDGQDNNFTKPLYNFFFVFSHFKPFQWVFIKGCSCFSHDQKAINMLLGL